MEIVDPAAITAALPDGPPSDPSDWQPWPADALGPRLLEEARAWVGLRSLRKVTRQVHDDCSGFVRLAYLRAGLRLAPSEGRRGDNLTTAFWRRARRLGEFRKENPRPGDLVFFRETYDRDHDGKRDDGLTHVGLVEAVEEDGTVLFLHRGQDGVKRSRLNLHDGERHRGEGGKVLNDWLRARDRRHRAYTAGELLDGFAPPHVLLEAQEDR